MECRLSNDKCRMLESLRSIFFYPKFGTPEIAYPRVGCAHRTSLISSAKGGQSPPYTNLWAWSKAHRAWRVEQDGLNPGYLASDIWLRVAGHGLRISRYWNADLGF